MLLLALPGADPANAPLILGLPPRAAFLLLGIGLGPALLIPVAYALVFDRHTLTPEDLDRLRAAAERVRQSEGHEPASREDGG